MADWPRQDAEVAGLAIADVAGLQDALAGKADLEHGHAIADVAGLQDALAGLQPALAGVVDGVPAMVHLRPAGDDNALVIEAPDADWGVPGVDAYARGQALVVLKEDPDGSLIYDDRVMARIDRKGGGGFAGGLHLATGFRARAEDIDNIPYSVHIDPSIDVPGLLVDGAPGGLAALQQWRLDDATVLAEVNSTGQLFAHRGVAVASGAAGTQATVTVKRDPAGGNDGQLIAAAANNAIAPGTAIGDLLLRAVDTADGTGVVHLIGHNAIRLSASAAGVALNGNAPVAKKAAIASPAATLAALKTAVDLLIVAVRDVGVTA